MPVAAIWTASSRESGRYIRMRSHIGASVIAILASISTHRASETWHRSVVSTVKVLEDTAKSGPYSDWESGVPEPTEPERSEWSHSEGDSTLKGEETGIAARPRQRVSRRLRRHWERMDRDMQDLSVYDPQPELDVDHADALSGMMEGPDWHPE